MAALLALMGSLVLARGADQALATGPDLPTMAFALLDGVIAVSGTLWFIAWLRARWPSHGPLAGTAARASYATYLIHPLVLTAAMVAFASVALAPGIKFVLVATAGMAACFTAGYALTRVPGISKVLCPTSTPDRPRIRSRPGAGELAGRRCHRGAAGAQDAQNRQTCVRRHAPTDDSRPRSIRQGSRGGRASSRSVIGARPERRAHCRPGASAGLG